MKLFVLALFLSRPGPCLGQSSIRGRQQDGIGGSENNGNGNGTNRGEAPPQRSVDFNPKGTPLDERSDDVAIQVGEIEANGLDTDFNKVPVIKFRGILAGGHRPLIFHRKDVSAPTPVASRARRSAVFKNRKVMVENATKDDEFNDSLTAPLMWYGEEQGQGLASATFIYDLDGSVAGMISDGDMSYKFNTVSNGAGNVIKVTAMNVKDIPDEKDENKENENEEEGGLDRRVLASVVDAEIRANDDDNKANMMMAGVSWKRELQDTDTCAADDLLGLPCDDRLGYYGEWYDYRGPTFTCAWYKQNNSRCTADGDNFENFGYTAKRACCDCGGGGVEIDVMFVTTAGARNEAGSNGAMERDIFIWMFQANVAFELSGISTRVRLVHIDHDATFTESGKILDDIFKLKDANTDLGKRIANKRRDYGADIVALAVVSSNVCGVAGGGLLTDGGGYAVPENMKKADGFIVLKSPFQCTSRYTFAHELGHVLGGRHHVNFDTGGTDNHGYITPDGEYATLMVPHCQELYPNGCKKAMRYSNTRYLYNGYKMGGISQLANVAKHIEIRSRFVKDFNPTKQKCDVSHPSWIGDGYCDKSDAYNTAICGWDGGDCCEKVCGDGQYTCGYAGYDCKDPAITRGVAIVSEKNGECLGVARDGSKNANVWKCVGTGNQQWVYDHSTKQIQSIESDDCLDMSTSSSYSYNVYMHSCHDGDNQKWTYDAATDAFKSVRSPSKCLDMSSSKNVYMHNCHHGTNQKWQVPDSFFMSNTRKNGFIWLNSKNLLCLEMRESDKNVFLGSCDSNTMLNKWVHYPNREIRSASNNWCLDYSYNTGNLYVHPCHGNANQKWTVANNGYALRSDYYYWPWDPWMCVEASASTHGSNVVMKECKSSGRDLQRWDWPDDFLD